jgi:hypothetical protein
MSSDTVILPHQHSPATSHANFFWQAGQILVQAVQVSGVMLKSLSMVAADPRGHLRE